MTAIPNRSSSILVEALYARRSVPARQLAEPAPSGEELERMLAAAVRVPDHGKRVPFRFLDISGEARHALGEAVAARGDALRGHTDEAAATKDRNRFSHAPLVVAVVARLDPDDHAIPEEERLLSAGCTCFALLMAAQGMGYGATWLTGWPAHDAGVRELLGLAQDERIVGFVHIGTPQMEPRERERPDAGALLSTWTPAA